MHVMNNPCTGLPRLLKSLGKKIFLESPGIWRKLEFWNPVVEGKVLQMKIMERLLLWAAFDAVILYRLRSLLSL